VVRGNEAGVHLVRGLGFGQVTSRSVKMVSDECLLIFQRVA
jgi:hypothetical protein